MFAFEVNTVDMLCRLKLLLHFIKYKSWVELQPQNILDERQNVTVYLFVINHNIII